MGKLYPDISHHHPVKTWADVQEHVGFLITKATEGTSFVDATLFPFIRECESRVIPYWLYTFLRKGNELAQAKFLVNTCKGKVGPYFQGYVLDIESGNDETACMTALAWLKKQSSKTMIYTGYSDRNKYKRLIETRGDACAWWEARYGLNTGRYNPLFPCHKGVDLHQYTSRGTCPGIPDKIDMNRLTGTLPESWFADGRNPAANPVPKTNTYGGEFPALPGRGYYKKGDGYETLKSFTTEIRKIQRFINWMIEANLAVDGKYGDKTESAVKAAQLILKTKTDGLFGRDTLAKAKAYKK